MITLSARHFPTFRNVQHLTRLNRLMEQQSHFVPHEVASATGCSLDEALGILMRLYDAYFAEAFLLIYHNAHLESSYSMKQPIVTGFPKLPFECEVCDEVITNLNELFFDFMFMPTESVYFKVEKT